PLLLLRLPNDFHAGPLDIPRLPISVPSSPIVLGERRRASAGGLLQAAARRIPAGGGAGQQSSACFVRGELRTPCWASSGHHSSLHRESGYGLQVLQFGDPIGASGGQAASTILHLFLA
ncbi:unnamed protein product, partial [Urochloa humidicola]